MKFIIKDFFSKCDQIHSFLPIWSHLLKKSLIENFIFCAVLSRGSFLVILIIFWQMSIIAVYFPFLTEKLLYYSNCWPTFDWQNFINVPCVKVGKYQYQKVLRPMGFGKCPVNILKCRKFFPSLVNCCFNLWECNL